MPLKRTVDGFLALRPLEALDGLSEWVEEGRVRLTLLQTKLMAIETQKTILSDTSSSLLARIKRWFASRKHGALMEELELSRKVILKLISLGSTSMGSWLRSIQTVAWDSQRSGCIG